MNRIRLLVLLLGFVQLTFAQDLKVTGKVSDTSGEPLPGVNVVVKGTKTGVATDFDGNYSITVQKGKTLVFSSVGYETISKVANSITINVIMKEAANQLDKVVITAMGIKKKEKGLGYASQQIKVSDMKQVNPNALANLQGQVSGVQITQSSGAAGGGVDILIRGVKSLDASVNSQPLIIIDGVRVNNDVVAGNVMPSDGSNAPSSSEQFAFANRGIDFNPDDIASINVLKGAAAAALYGIDASNGAIVITTKKGHRGEARYTLTSRFSISGVNKFVELQDKWREGYGRVARVTMDPNHPNINPTQTRGYGADKGYWLINGAPYSFHTWGPAYADDNDPTIKFHDMYRDFFKSGIGTNLNFSVRGGKEKYNYYLSIGRNATSGIVPNTDYNKTNLRLRADYQLSKKFNLEVVAGYTNSNGALPNNGDKSIMSSLSYWSPSIDINDYKLPDGKQKNYTPYWIDNSRYFAEVSNLKTNVDRFVASANAKLKFTDKFNLNYRVSMDNYVDVRNRFVPGDLDVGTKVNGFIIDQNIRFNSLSSLLLLNYGYDVNKDVKLNFMAGNEVSTQQRTSELSRGEGLILPMYNNISNAENFFNSQYTIGKNRVGLFGEVGVAYKDKLFLSVTGRNDWSSTLPEQNRSFFYPSVNLAYVVYDGSKLEKKGILSFAKIRTSWANVGKDAKEGILGAKWGLGLYPNNSSGGSVGSIYPYLSEGDVNLKPENQRTTEIGFDVRFLENRIRLDYTYYDNLNTDLITKIYLPGSTGKKYIWTNAGSLTNKGHELLLSAKWIDKNDFSWRTIINWSTNSAKVSDLPDGVESIEYVSSGYAGVVSMVKEGDAPGTLYGYTWKYNENGDRIIDANGFPIIDTSKKVIVGNAFPDWVGSIQNNFGYKNLNLSFLFEYKKGGDMYDAGQRNSIRDGILKITEFRYENTTLEGVQSDGNGGWIPNNTEVMIDKNYYRSSSKYNRASEILVQDASWLKLRNISMSYSVPQKWLNKTMLNKLQITVSGNNFLLWTPFRGFDPEGSQFSAGSNTYGFTGLNIPLTKSYSLGVKIGF